MDVLAPHRIPDATVGLNRSSVVNVVLASDRKFLPFCATTIASILKHSAEEDELHFYVTTDAPLPPLHAQRFQALQSIKRHKFTPVVVDASQFSQIRTTPGISLATYYRLLLPTVLDKSIDKVLYVDCDLVVLDRIRKLYDVDVSKYYFVGVEDTISREYNRGFGLPEFTPHINGGVMLINLAALRKIEFNKMISEYLASHQFTITLGDQEIINTVFQGHVGYVHPRWNAHGSMFERGWREKNVGIKNCYTMREVEDATTRPSIIHYTYKRKPWESNNHPRADIYVDYMRLTQYAAEFEPVFASFPAHTYRTKALKILKTATRPALRKLADRGVDALVDPAVNRRTKSINARADFAADAAYDYWMGCIAERANNEIKLGDLVKSGTFLSFIGNASKSDIDQGELRNYKILFRSNKVSNPSADADWEDCDALFLCRWRRAEGHQMSILRNAVALEKPLLFVETSFFAGCVTWANREAPVMFRRPFGFIVDDLAYYYDATRASRLRRRLRDPNYHLDARQTARARTLIERITSEKITKYNSMPDILLPSWQERPRRVLVVDQSAGDASITLGRASAPSFRRMLEAAIRENPDAQVLVKTHPDTQVNAKSGRPGYFGPMDHPNVTLVTDSVNPHTLISIVDKVYVVSSQFGFEALLHGKPVVCFGDPFYSGLGLTDDRVPASSRNPRAERTIEELFTLACIDMSYYVDPDTGDYCSIERALDIAVDLREKWFAYRPDPVDDDE